MCQYEVYFVTFSRYLRNKQVFIVSSSYLLRQLRHIFVCILNRTSSSWRSLPAEQILWTLYIKSFSYITAIFFTNIETKNITFLFFFPKTYICDSFKKVVKYEFCKNILSYLRVIICLSLGLTFTKVFLVVLLNFNLSWQVIRKI